MLVEVGDALADRLEHIASNNIHFNDHPIDISVGRMNDRWKILGTFSKGHHRIRVVLSERIIPPGRTTFHMQKASAVTKFRNNFCRFLPRYLYPICINFKEYGRINALKKPFINKSIANPVSVLPPVIVQAESKVVRLRKAAGFIVNIDQLLSPI